LLLALLLGSSTVGTEAIIASNVIYHHTSNNAFCTSCHSMAIQADDAYFKRSAHRSNSKGVIASCGDCHIPKTNWFVETYVKDIRRSTTFFRTRTISKIRFGRSPVKLTEEARPGCAGGTVSPAAVMTPTR
jgi:nitrate/TMAO reductase-like tetraheme cytochrome c subunit